MISRVLVPMDDSEMVLNAHVSGTETVKAVHSDGEETLAVTGTRLLHIVTGEDTEVVAEIHDRMPVMLEPDEEQPWLTEELETAKDVLDRFPATELSAYPVSKRVNDPNTEGPELFEEIGIGEQSALDDFSG